ncbi:hypothetical protein GCM10008955_17360 [Deinococcus malanensis]|uniref:Uncharacterized protein n=1 Tax=Deinococcus malanensis TaxID=1706855 RepID=A0ABQ2ESZ9_9DEIO|nr:hypothetical protein [Deinococcus malanensis]GGK24333.1 hypothetical protein GCM10008955_17360 [Deinococcus malanensis]
MPIPVTLIDESTAGSKRTFTLDFLEEHVTVRELIRRRVYEEVTEYNARQPEVFQGLIQPTDAERTLNGYRLKAWRKLDWEAQYQRATEAFKKHGFVVLVDERQVDDLDEQVHLRLDRPTEVTFLKLVALVGG